MNLEMFILGMIFGLVILFVSLKRRVEELQDEVEQNSISYKFRISREEAKKILDRIRESEDERKLVDIIIDVLEREIGNKKG